MKIEFSRTKTLALLKNARIPKKTMTAARALFLTQRAGEVLHDAGFKFTRIVNGPCGYTLDTTYGIRRLRFCLSVADKDGMVGTVLEKDHIGFLSRAVVKLSGDIINIISDDAGIPSMTLSLRREHEET